MKAREFWALHQVYVTRTNFSYNMLPIMGSAVGTAWRLAVSPKYFPISETTWGRWEYGFTYPSMLTQAECRSKGIDPLTYQIVVVKELFCLESGIYGLKIDSSYQQSLVHTPPLITTELLTFSISSV